MAMMVMMVVVAMMPAVPPIMMVVAMVPPMNFRRRQPGVLLNRGGATGIAERQRIGAFDWRSERKQCANGRKPQNFRELHNPLLGSGTTSASNCSPQRCTQSGARDLNSR
ncbi:hypothetical protein [Bradyrhizobium sp. CCBAU 051011]|uniref:hypothetical protein n=1 Tax=Bradyrhizobium sp. CCBAU 051011 TaxID=858422 RepID=UPI001AEF1794